MKIHISEDSANVLGRFGIFNIEPRGKIEIKGKGLMNTYWLTGKSAHGQQQPALEKLLVTGGNKPAGSLWNQTKLT